MVKNKNKSLFLFLFPFFSAPSTTSSLDKMSGSLVTLPCQNWLNWTKNRHENVTATSISFILIPYLKKRKTNKNTSSKQRMPWASASDMSFFFTPREFGWLARAKCHPAVWTRVARNVPKLFLKIGVSRKETGGELSNIVFSRYHVFSSRYHGTCRNTFLNTLFYWITLPFKSSFSKHLLAKHYVWLFVWKKGI